MPRLTPDHDISDIDEPLPAAFTLSVEETEAALLKIKTGKATGPDNIPPWIPKDFAHILSCPIAAIYNSSLAHHVEDGHGGTSPQEAPTHVNNREFPGVPSDFLAILSSISIICKICRLLEFNIQSICFHFCGVLGEPFTKCQ